MTLLLHTSVDIRAHYKFCIVFNTIPPCPQTGEGMVVKEEETEEWRDGIVYYYLAYN